MLDILLVEDDPVFGQMMGHFLRQDPEHSVRHATTGREAVEMWKAREPHLIILDYTLPDTSGEEVLQQIRSKSAEVQVIVLSGQQDIRVAVELLRGGAFDYIVKDEGAAQRTLNVIQFIKSNRRLQEEVRALRSQLNHRTDLKTHLLGESPKMAAVRQLLEKALNNTINVLISGETGTGKEVVANAIHKFGNRANQPFVAVNMAAIPQDLLESELFGHEKGAFTGAMQQRIGSFEQAHRGTLFLDEIGEMPLHLQAKLLRVLQERQVTRLGGYKPVDLDIRLLVATHRDLKTEVKAGRFRQDLYFRLQGLRIEMPPLRERAADVLLLAQQFADSFAKRNQLPLPVFQPDARKKLMRYAWPGNVRELRSTVELAVVLASDAQIEAEHLQLENGDELLHLLDKELTLREYNCQIVKHFLDKYRGNVLEVSRRLDVGKSTLYRMFNANPAYFGRRLEE
jgi:DNA-binding NtrC family response regulator